MKRYLVPPVLLRKSFYTYIHNIARRLNRLASLIRIDLFRSNKKVWQEPNDCPYKNVIVAKGIYKGGKRVGTWVFTSDIVRIIESYNYDENIIVIDSSDEKMLEYTFAGGIKALDPLINRVKIGGFFCSLPSLIFQRELSETIQGRFPDGIELDCSQTFILGLSGAIIKYEIRVKYDNIERGYTWDESMPDTELKHFIPPFYSDYN